VCVTGIELAAGWTGRGSNTGGGEIFRSVQISPEPHSPPIERISGISRGWNGESVMLNTHSVLVWGC